MSKYMNMYGISRELVECRPDTHGNMCLIHDVKDRWGTRRGFTIQYEGSLRRWLKKDGSPYFASLHSARRRIDTN